MDDSAISLPATSPDGTGSPLGITAKSSSPCDGVSPKAKRAERYAALSVARVWLGRVAAVVDDKRAAGDLYRTHDCRWVRRAHFVGVMYAAQHQSSHFTGLATCGSVWACPVCCALIQQRRRLELVQLLDWTYSQGHSASMVTFTFPHTRFDSLSDLLNRQRLAFKRFRSGKAWQGFKTRYGFVGLVRSLELTHGKNGWHPHTHELWITRPLSPLEQAQFREFVLDRWMKVCAAVGLLDESDSSSRHAFLLHSLDVRFSAKDSDYLAKQDNSRSWGVDREIATSSSKKGRAAGVHPHEFLVRQSQGDFDRFIEYVHGMAGQRQLYWSSRLKEKCGLDDVTDEVLADESRTPADLLINLSASDWDYVRKANAHAEILEAAETGDYNNVLRVLHSLGVDPRGL